MNITQLFAPAIVAAVLICLAAFLWQCATLWEVARRMRGDRLTRFCRKLDAVTQRLFANPQAGAIADFIPTIWTARFLQALQDNFVYGSRVNRNYEGEVAAYGDTVKIPMLTSTVTVRDYTANQDIADPELANGDTREFAIDRQRYFHLYVDDVNAAQARPDLMTEAMRIAGITVAQDVDKYVAGKFVKCFANARRVSDATAAADAAAAGASHILSVAKLKRMMTEAKLPLAGRWLIVPPQFTERLEAHFLTNPGANAGGIYTPATNEETLRNGFAGRLLGFDLLTTNLVPSGAGVEDDPFKVQAQNATYRCVAGQGNEVVTFAEQITEVEAYRPEKRFGDAVKGLYVYGADRIQPLDQRIFYLQIVKG